VLVDRALVDIRGLRVLQEPLVEIAEGHDEVHEHGRELEPPLERSAPIRDPAKERVRRDLSLPVLDEP
jgi:hypothetical protein